MADLIRCPKCNAKNFSTDVACTKCGTPLTTTKATLEEITQVLLTSTPALDGYVVTQYLGVMTANVILGSNWSTDWNTFIASADGTRATKLQTNLQAACQAAFYELRAQAHAAGCNAVIGADVDYEVFGNNMLMVSANGTAVIVEHKRA